MSSVALTRRKLGTDHDPVGIVLPDRIENAHPLRRELVSYQRGGLAKQTHDVEHDSTSVPSVVEVHPDILAAGDGLASVATEATSQGQRR